MLSSCTSLMLVVKPLFPSSWLQALCTLPPLNHLVSILFCPRRYQTAIGYPDAAKECLLKRVRALGGAGWQSSADGFRTYAAASLALCRAYLQVSAGGVVGGNPAWWTKLW